MDSYRRRVGVFGGTFDPPHVAHVHVAAAAIHQLALDQLLVIPAGQPWQKVGSRTISPPSTRLRMAVAAFEMVDKVLVSDLEITREGDTYTVDTLGALGEAGTELFLLLGSDAAAGLDTWDRSDQIAELATIVVFPRRGFETAAPPNGFAWTGLELPGLEVSSSDLRRRVAHGEPISGLVPPLVEAIIRSEGLFLPS